VTVVNELGDQIQVDRGFMGVGYDDHTQNNGSNSGSGSSDDE